MFYSIRKYSNPLFYSKKHENVLIKHLMGLVMDIMNKYFLKIMLNRKDKYLKMFNDIISCAIYWSCYKCSVR